MTTLAQTKAEAGRSVENLSPLKTTLLAYKKESLQQFAQLLKAADVGPFLQLFAGNFGHADKLQCEMALAIFSPGDDLDAFVHDVATLKLIAKVPCLLVVVNEGGMSQVSDAKTELAADDILYLPLPPQELGKILKTYVASLRIEHKKKSQRMDFSKKAQALEIGRASCRERVCQYV